MSQASLAQHLHDRYDIREFNDDSYWEWGGERMGFKLGAKIEKLREPLVNGKATAQDYLKFYDIIATQPALSVVHSLKTGAMIASGKWIEQQIRNLGLNPKKWLDVGCHTGHITSYYASTFPDTDVTGIDLARVAISTARQLGIERNLSFFRDDLLTHQGSYDIITSTQSVAASSSAEMLPHIKRLLSEGGSFLAVEACGTKADRRTWIDEAKKAGLALKTVDIVLFSTLGDEEAYTAFHCTNQKADSLAPAAWEESISDQLAKLLLPNN